MTDRRRADLGLSLVEVLVSLAIFAIIGVAGLAVLNTVARTGERTDGRLDRLSELDRAFLVMRRDLAQVTPGRMTLEASALAFQRAAGETSVSIEYRLGEGAALLRRIDRPGAPEVDQALLPGVTGVRWRLMDNRRTWQSDWPPADTARPGRPQAAEVTLDLDLDGAPGPQSVARLFVLPAGQGQ